jgi:hypothetical protein
VPYKASSATLTITTVGVGFPYLTVNPDTVKWDQEVYHEARLLDDYGYPVVGELVQFQWYYGGAWKTVCEVSTDSLGYAKCRWKVPYSADGVKFPCNTFKVRAYAPAFGVASPEKTVKVYSETQMVAGTNKTSYVPGEDVIVSGKLQEITPTGTAPLANMSVTITWWDGTKTTVTTGSDGSFTATKKAPTTKGTYSITVEFAGAGGGLVLGLAVQPIQALRRGLIGLLQEAPPLLSLAGLAISTAGLAIGIANLKHGRRYWRY